MKLNKIIQTATLLAALGTSGIAAADHMRGDDCYAEQQSSLDVIGQKALRDRGTVTFTITPEMRRDGLQLMTDASRLAVSRIEFIYSDGRVVPVRPARTLADGRLVTIQTGRPPGLREVKVSYTVGGNDRRAMLALVQLHTGDGYTHEEDLWVNHDDDGYYPEDDAQPAPQPRAHVRVRDHRRYR